MKQDLKTFLSSKYDSSSFEAFIKEHFYGLDIYDSERDHIQDYRYLGQVELDDGKEIGFFEFRSTSSHIENKRVGYNTTLKYLLLKYKEGTCRI